MTGKDVGSTSRGILHTPARGNPEGMLSRKKVLLGEIKLIAMSSRVWCIMLPVQGWI